MTGELVTVLRRYCFRNKMGAKLAGVAVLLGVSVKGDVCEGKLASSL
jgi:hypothetical protein